MVLGVDLVLIRYISIPTIASQIKVQLFLSRFLPNLEEDIGVN
jgi:hypothetical protein